MRLAVFTNQFPSPISTFFARDMRALIAAGIELDIFAFYPEQQAHWALVPDLLGDDVLERRRVHHSTPAELLRAAVPLPPRAWASFARDSAGIIGDALRFGGLPAAKSAYAAANAWIWSRRYPEPAYDHILAYWGNYAASCAYLFHRLTHPDVPFSMFARARVDLYQHQASLAEKFLYADNIFLVCEYNRQFIAETFPAVFPHIERKIRIHYTGLPLGEIGFIPGGRPERTIVAVGRLEPLKGFSRLLEALALLAHRGVEARLEVVGAGDQLPELQALTTRLGLAPQVTFHGFLPPDETIAVMRRATLLVHPPIERDAMPNVLKEALAVGTPVIASDLAGASEILDGGRCGLLVPAGDVAALASAIARMLTDPALRERLASAGRRHMENRFDMWRNGDLLAAHLRASERRGTPVAAHAT
jgi:glycosyltransferase involved in cell wall biosynthesis